MSPKSNSFLVYNRKALAVKSPPRLDDDNYDIASFAIDKQNESQYNDMQREEL